MNFTPITAESLKIKIRLAFIVDFLDAFSKGLLTKNHPVLIIILRQIYGMRSFRVYCLPLTKDHANSSVTSVTDRNPTHLKFVTFSNSAFLFYLYKGTYSATKSLSSAHNHTSANF